MNIQKTYNVGIYCRLSQDDGNSGDSSSVETQKMTIEKYCLDNNFIINDYYVDDGYSGINFDRPSFHRLLDDIDDGKINLVIAKDLSRLGRNYIQCGYYMEIYFADRNIRFIAIDDNIDTLRNDNDIAPFKNILNEIYIKDLSRKIKSAKIQRAMQGMFLGGAAPYGYKKDPNNKNKLIIDPDAAQTVKRIFDLILSGNTIMDITRKLTNDGIFTPAVSKANAGDIRFQRYIAEGQSGNWNSGGIHKIINDPVYTGSVAYSKTEIVNYKTQRSITNPKNKWIIVPDMHEAIISKEDFSRAQELIKKRRVSRTKYSFNDLFEGLVKCSICGRSMNLNIRTTKGRQEIYYSCHANRIERDKEKHWTTIRYVKVKEIVTSGLKDYFASFENDNKLIDFIELQIKNSNLCVDYEKELLKLEERQDTLSRIIKKVSDDYIDGIITNETHNDLIKKFEVEQNELKNKSCILSNEKSNKGDQKEDKISDYLSLNILTKEMVYKLIDSIEVTSIGEYQRRKENAVKITYRFPEMK